LSNKSRHINNNNNSFEMTNNVNVDEIVDRIRNNDPSLTIVNLNSHFNISKDPANPSPPDPATAHAVAEALKHNNRVVELHVCLKRFQLLTAQ
jgi:hypothetical protein